jgi:DnaK suppressor protein
VTTTRDSLLAERARTLSRVAALDREFAGIAEAASEPGTDDEHDPEGATLAFERQHTAALLARAREQITEIDAAIGRLDAGTYGVCVRCGRPIGRERLAARPAAATCVRCARRVALESAKRTMCGCWPAIYLSVLTTPDISLSVLTILVSVLSDLSPRK